MESLTSKQKIILAIAGIVVIGIFVVYMNTKSNSYNYTSINEMSENIETNDEKETEEKEEDKIKVHITGAVLKEGIVELISGARIQDAIDEAGGLTKEANLTQVNLAYVLKDGQKIYIPRKTEVKEVEKITTFENEEKVIIDEGEEENKNLSGKININTANAVQLQTLNGIGEETAQKIINYRNANGKFKKIEDLKNVSGIGEAKYNNIKEYICVE